MSKKKNVIFDLAKKFLENLEKVLENPPLDDFEIVPSKFILKGNNVLKLEFKVKEGAIGKESLLQDPSQTKMKTYMTKGDNVLSEEQLQNLKKEK